MNEHARELLADMKYWRDRAEAAESQIHRQGEEVALLDHLARSFHTLARASSVASHAHFFEDCDDYECKRAHTILDVQADTP